MPRWRYRDKDWGRLGTRLRHIPQWMVEGVNKDFTHNVAEELGGNQLSPFILKTAVGSARGGAATIFAAAGARVEGCVRTRGRVAAVARGLGRGRGR